MLAPTGGPHPTFQDHNFIPDYLNILRIAWNTFACWKIKQWFSEIFIAVDQETCGGAPSIKWASEKEKEHPRKLKTD